MCGSGGSGHAGDLAPGSEGTVALLPVGGGGQAVATWTAVRGDRAVGGEEALGVARGLEPPHPAFPLPGRLMGMLRPVMQALVPPLRDAGPYRAPRRAVTGEFVGAHHARHGAQALVLQW